MRRSESTTELGPAEFFAFDASKLNPGDILLSTVPNDRTSIAIRIGTWSRFSHAAISTDPPLFIEAVGIGTRPFSILRIGVKDKRWVRMLRLKATVTNHADRALDAGKRANTYLGRGYWLVGALAAKIPGANLQERTGVFCSHLVAQAYREAGVDLVPGLPPHKVTPKALSRSPLLRDITEDILIPTAQEKWPMELDLTDVGIGPGPVDQEIKIRLRVADRIESALRTYRKDLLDESVLRKYGIVSSDKASRFDKLLAGLVCSYQDNPMLARTIDSHFAHAIEEEGYLSIPEMLFDEATLYIDQATAYYIEQKLWDCEKMENHLTFYRQNYATLLMRIDELRDYTHTYKEGIKKTGLSTFYLLARTHERYWGYAEEVREVLRKTIIILESALSAVNEKG